MAEKTAKPEITLNGHKTNEANEWFISYGERLRLSLTNNEKEAAWKHN